MENVSVKIEKVIEPKLLKQYWKLNC